MSTKSTPSRLRLYRQISGLSQAELAKRVGVSQPLISDFERQVLFPGPELRTRLAAALGVPDDEFFGEGQ